MSEKATKTETVYRVRVMTTHPRTGELLFAGDAVALAPEEVPARLLEARVFVPEPPGTPENRAPRGEPSRLVGINAPSDLEKLQELARLARGGA